MRNMYKHLMLVVSVSMQVAILQAGTTTLDNLTVSNKIEQVNSGVTNLVNGKLIISRQGDVLMGPYTQGTLPYDPLYIINCAVMNVKPDSATFNGSLVSEGSGGTKAYVYWGATDGGTNKGSWSNEVEFGTRSAGLLSTNISGLTSLTTNYYKYYASNSTAEVWADDVISFFTSFFDPYFDNTILFNYFTPPTNFEGNIIDYSALATNVGTIHNNAVYNGASNGLSAYYSLGDPSSGIDFQDLDCFTMRNATGDLPFTVACVIRPTSLYMSGGIFGKSINVSAYEYNLFCTAALDPMGTSYGTDALSFRVHGQSESLGGLYVYRVAATEDNAVKRFVRDFIVCTYDGSGATNGLKIYRNQGRRIDAKYFESGTWPGMSNTAAPLTVGYVDQVGTLGDVSYYKMYTNIVMSASEVNALFYNEVARTNGWGQSLMYADVSLWSNSVAEYLFDYNYPADTSVAGANHCSLTGGSADPLWQADGTNGWYAFDGYNDCLVSTNAGYAAQTISNLTYEMWVFISNYDAVNYGAASLVKEEGAYSVGPRLWLMGNWVGGWVGYTNQSFGFSSDINEKPSMVLYPTPSNTWTHLVMTYDRSATPRTSIYIDGIQQILSYTNDTASIYVHSETSGKAPFTLGCAGLAEKRDMVRKLNCTVSSNYVWTSYNNTKSRYGR